MKVQVCREPMGLQGEGGSFGGQCGKNRDSPSFPAPPVICAFAESETKIEPFHFKTAIFVFQS